MSILSTYDKFIPLNLRAQCLRVVDGDTADLFIDCGFHQFTRLRIRLAGINAPELTSKDPMEREAAQKAKQWLIDTIVPASIVDMVVLTEWKLRVVTYKDPDNFGRWLGELFVKSDAGEISVNATMLELGLARPYLPRPL